MRTIVALLLIAISLNAQERVLLHITEDGRQEVIPLKKSENTSTVISQIEKEETSLVRNPTSIKEMIDTLKHFPNDLALTTVVDFYHQDVALQWFVPAAGGRVKEFWWKNYFLQGNIKKGTIRAWYVNSKLATRPTSVRTKHLGYYKDPHDSDGFVTAFKPVSGDTFFYGNGLSDSSTWRFDPLGSEVSTWVENGIQVSLESKKWQGIKLEEFGDSMFVNLGQLFGFTLSNDSRVADTAADGKEISMELPSMVNTGNGPYHSLKWYERGRSNTTDKGWHLRGDYDWGMYVVVEYTRDRSPKIELQGDVQTTLQTSARPITVKVTDDNPGGGPAGVQSVYMKTKNAVLSSYDSVLATNNGPLYTGFTKAGLPGDTIYWQFVATDANGNRTVFGPKTYIIFKRKGKKLLLYNNPTFSIGNSGASLIYIGGSSLYDRWSAISDGISELDKGLALYNDVILADGSFPSKNVYPAIKTWFLKGTPTMKKNLFFTSQDYGCFIGKACAETTFVSGSLEYDYLGIQKLGPQNLGPTNRPYQIIPLPDMATNYMIKFNKDSSTTLWHYPTFELTSTFLSYPDAMTPRSDAQAVYTDGSGTNILGVVYHTAVSNSMFIAFDAGALQFRSDTSLHTVAYTTITDPKYHWIVDIGPPAVEYFKCVCEQEPPLPPDGVEEIDEKTQYNFSLGNNYPNPFNPTTEISYQIPASSHVTLKVFDMVGREIATVIDGMKEAGNYTVTFNGQSLSSGMYFYEMRAGSFVSVKKMLLMK